MAKNLVKDGLAACVVITRTTSIYKWEGKVEETEEFLLSIKTKKSLYPQVEHVIQELHSYELPQIIALPIKKGSKEYLQWINEETE